MVQNVVVINSFHPEMNDECNKLLSARWKLLTVAYNPYRSEYSFYFVREVSAP